MQQGEAGAALTPGTVSISGHLAAVVKLGAPVILSRIGMFGIIFADILMLGRFDSLELAYYGLANTIQFVFFVLGIGALSGIAVLTAQSVGAGEEKAIGTIWRIGSVHALVMGAIAFLLCLPGEFLLMALGQTAELAAGADHTLFYQAIGLPGAYLFLAGAMVLESLRRPGGVFVAMIIANSVNVALNWLLIGGEWGAPEMGAAGASLATSITRYGMALIVIVWILLRLDRQRYNLLGPMQRPWRVSRTMRRLGYALGLAQGLESASFAMMMIFAAWMGTASAAAWAININIVSFIFMGALGVSTATIVGVGEAVGAGSSANAARAGWSGALIVLIFMAGMGVVLASFPDFIAGIYSEDMAVVALSVSCLLIAALNLPGDGLQAVMMSALRGAGDVWIPTVLHLSTFVCGMIPAALLFAFGFDLGLPGLMLGITVGVHLAALFLALRFRQVCNRGVKRL